MSFELITYEVKGRIGLITLNRPKVLNALNGALMEEIHRAFGEVKCNPEVGGVIITGSGEKAFCAGADIDELRRNSPVAGVQTALRGQAILRDIELCGKPVIAAINGHCYGGGCELAMACTLRIASDNAKMGQPEVNLGIIPGYGGTQRLPRLVGKGIALELIITGRAITAEEAHRLGLVNKVVPQPELMAAAEEMLNTIMAKGPIAVRLCIEAVHRGMDMDLDNGLNLEAQLFGVVASTVDMKEGLNAFLEKRPAAFRNE
ncbi:MAG: enoyl-CoA hydratase-related protein [Candidatus Eisenbacteria bacterium]|nr:enoyl-CoA hydratase-related protein [Candidatus Eisenbacteria bacterium]